MAQKMLRGTETQGAYGGEDVSKKRKVILVLLAGWQLQSIEVSEGNTDVFGLAALVRAHGDVSVGPA